VLITDGESPDLMNGGARQIAAELLSDRIVLYAVYIGDGAAPAQLYELARPTMGAVFAANNPESLLGIFDHIDRMNPVKLKPVAPRPIDASWPFVIAGLAVLGTYQVTLLGLRYTPW
jgi:hypothetical protein